MKFGTFGLRWRIALWCALILLSVQLSGLLLFAQIGRHGSLANVRAELGTAERVFARLLDQRGAQLTQATRVLAADFGFREAVATRDRDTIGSALNNHGARIDANLMLLLDLEGRVIAEVPASDAPKADALVELIDAARISGGEHGLAVVHDTLHQLVVLPVLAPLPVAWVAVGFAVDQSFALDLEGVLGLEVSFVQRSGEQWIISGSSLTAGKHAALQPRLGDIRSGRDIIDIDGVEYVSLLTELVPGSGEGVAAVLQIPLERALAPWQALYDRWLWLSLVGMLLMLMASVWMGRTIASPVMRLARFARGVEDGDYTRPPKVERRDEIGELADAFSHMIDAIAARESRISELAYRDALTGLANRALFNEQAQSELLRAQLEGRGFAVVSLDIDRFSMVNDALGHHFGDNLLRAVAKRLAAIHPSAARLGGDEFAMHLSMTERNDALKAAAVIASQLEEPMSIQGQLIDVRASIGLALFPEHGTSIADLMRHADVAMSQAKRHKLGIEVYDPRHHEQNIHRLSLLTELRQAVERNELVLYYQPKRALRRTDRALHVEALVRWIHPQRGFISPLEFIPFAEQTGYIKHITEWVVEAAVAQCALWQQRGQAVHVGVNLSARDLANPDLAVLVGSVMTRHACNPELITLEITESALLEDPVHALENLHRLRALGCALSIDDYGTGYASLSYLKQMPVQEMKIDRSFVMNLLQQRGDEIIVRSTIELAHDMGLLVTAEGVEDEATELRLTALGCDFVQGYLISRPLSVEQFENWMREKAKGRTSSALGSRLNADTGSP